MGRLIRSRSRLVPRTVLSAHDEARAVLAKADALAKRAEESAEILRRESTAKGYTEGFKEGREQGYAEVSALLAAARVQTISEFTRAKDAGIIIGRKLAEKILGRTFMLEPSVIADLALQALVASRPRGGTLVLRIHPEELARLTTEREAWLARLPMVSDIRIVADESVDRGGCIVDTPVGRLDARLSTQLDALESALRKAMGEEGAE